VTDGALACPDGCYKQWNRIFKTSFLKAEITMKDITLYGLRNSFETHLPEAGTRLRYIQHCRVIRAAGPLRFTPM